MRRMLAVLLLAGLALTATATPAVAHTKLIASTPAEGATVPVAPNQLQLTFDGAVQAGMSTVAVTGPDGTQWTVGQPTVTGTVLTVPVQPAGPAGQYTISYRILSGDGHPVAGTVRFTLTDPVNGSTAEQPSGPPAAQRAATTNEGGGVPAWTWAVAALVLLGIGLVMALRMGRSSDSDEPS